MNFISPIHIKSFVLESFQRKIQSENCLSTVPPHGTCSFSGGSEVGLAHAVTGLASLARRKPPLLIIASLGIISIPATYNALNYAIDPVEHDDLFMQEHDGVWSTMICLCRDDIEATWCALIIVL
jgi:hypothetical protein